MKIGILTQPITTNYGGILQSLALQETLEKMGHEVTIINRVPGSERGCFYDVLGMIKRFLLKSFQLNGNIFSEEDLDYLKQNTQKFVSKYHHLSPVIKNTRQLKKYVTFKQLEAFVVGSDQCWRPRLSPNIYNYFLNFAEELDVKRIAYAASFGVDFWEYSKEQTAECSRLARKFDAISVREISGIQLCERELGVEAIHVLDPTMLLQMDYYKKLADDEKQLEGDLFCYVLDDTQTKSYYIKKVASELKLKPYYCMPKLKVNYENFKNNRDSCVAPPVTQWIRSFMDAKMIITDSFHGTVFSIIFNKPFWVIGNEKRGLARFSSLLFLFGLEDRLVTADNQGSVDYNKPILWERVNAKLEKHRVHSLNFIENNLCK